jgi:hypothetical protein
VTKEFHPEPELIFEVLPNTIKKMGLPELSLDLASLSKF